MTYLRWTNAGAQSQFVYRSLLGESAPVHRETPSTVKLSTQRRYHHHHHTFIKARIEPKAVNKLSASVLLTPGIFVSTSAT